MSEKIKVFLKIAVIDITGNIVINKEQRKGY